MKLDVNKEQDRNTLYGSLHAENAVRDRPPGKKGYNWVYTSEIIDANKIAIQDGVIVGFESNIGNLWKFQKVMQQNRMINTGSSNEYSDNPVEKLNEVIGNSITKIVFYKGSRPVQQINFSLTAFQHTSEDRMEHEQTYRKKMYEITGGFDTQPYDGIFEQSAVFKHPSGGNGHVFPLCAYRQIKTNLQLTERGSRTYCCCMLSAFLLWRFLCVRDLGNTKTFCVVSITQQRRKGD